MVSTASASASEERAAPSASSAGGGYSSLSTSWRAATSRDHWISDRRTTHCALASCGQPFDWYNRRHHCRRCGLVFCAAHSSKRMRLAPDATPSDAGELVRVCDTCVDVAPHAHVAVTKTDSSRWSAPPAKSAALNPHVAGAIVRRDRTRFFLSRRAQCVADERERLVPVLSVYEQLLGTPTAQRDERSKELVRWLADHAALACPIAGCHKPFSTTLRRHHCRLCGQLACSEHCSARPIGELALKACSVCRERLERHERALAWGKRREEASQTPLTLRFDVLARTTRAVRDESLRFEQLVRSLLAADVRPFAADLERAFELKRNLDALHSALMGELKRFSALDVPPAERALRDSAARAPTSLLRECLPRYRALCRQLVGVVEEDERREAAAAPGAAGSGSSQARELQPHLTQSTAPRATDGVAASRVGGSIGLEEYVLAKKAFIELSRSLNLYRHALTADLLEWHAEELGRILAVLQEELHASASRLRLDFNQQLLEISHAITAPRRSEALDAAGPQTRDALLSKILGVTASAHSLLEQDVRSDMLVSPRAMLRGLKEELKELYMAACIPY